MGIAAGWRAQNYHVQSVFEGSVATFLSRGGSALFVLVTRSVAFPMEL